MPTDFIRLNKSALNRLSCCALLPALCLAVPANAQTLSIQQIDKIVIRQNQGGMGGGVAFTFVVTKSNNGWESRRIRKYSNLISNKTAEWETIDSTQNVFINNISQATVGKMVYAIAHPIKNFSPGLFGITAGSLKVRADSIVKATFYQATPEEITAIKNALTPERVKQAIIRQQESDPTDVADVVKIAIVKKNGDTLKVESFRLSSYKLPWKIAGKTDAYNMAITRFCAAALNEGKRSFLNGGDMYYDIYLDIYNKYCKDQVTASYFRGHFAAAFKQLETVYTISMINTSDILQSGDPLLFMRLHPNGMPSNVVVNTALYIKHDKDVARLAGLKGRFDSVMMRKNFVFDFAARSPGYRLIIEDPNDSLSQYARAQNSYAYLRGFPQQSIVQFSLQNASNLDEYSQWVLLPNGKLVLLYLSGPTVLSFNRQQLKLDQQPPQAIETCVVFSADGKITDNFTR